MKRFAILFLLLGLAGCDWFLPGGLGGTPSVSSAVPAPGAENVSPGAAVKVDLNLRSGDLNLTSVNTSSVTLTDTATGQAVSATVTPDNDAERLTLIPSAPLAFDTEYRFDITSSVEDEAGQAFTPYSSTFTTLPDGVPSVIGSVPADGAVDVPVTIESIQPELNATGDGVDGGTLTGNVYLTNLSNNQRIPGGVNTSGGNDTIGFTPTNPLEEGTEYQFDVTSGVKTQDGGSFVPYTSTFFTSGDRPITTGNIALVPQPTSTNERHSSLAVLGSYLYASTIDGRILRYPIGSGGTLGAAELLTTIKGSSGEDRFVVGFTFDPAATPENPIAWISSSASARFQSDSPGDPANFVRQPWSGKITRLSGPNLQTAQDYVIGLPRSSKDHLTNSIAINPAEPGVLYFNQGSSNAMGAPDQNWDYQPERLLSGAVLRLDTNGLATPLNVQTEDGVAYNPFAAGAPLTIYATGIRNAYDLVWHSNGNLYIPANGSARNGNMPRYNPIPGTCENRPDGGYNGTMLSDTGALPGYIATATNRDGDTVTVDGWRIPETMNDYLINVDEGGYYGSPNPKRCEWILYGGGVGTGGGEDRIPGFPASVEPDPNYRGYAYNFGKQISPNGVVEYKGDTFPDLEGKLLVAQYSGGDDIVAIGLDGNGNVVGEKVSVAGRFSDPIDIAEDPSTGLLYVSAYDATGKSPNGPAGITLLQPE